MNANHDLYLDLCAAYAVGSIEPDDRRLLDEHLDGRCAECLAFLRDLSTPIEALARSVPAAKPSRGLKARVMVAISQGRGPGGGPAAPRPAADDGPDRVLPVWAWVVIVALALAAAFGWWRASMGEPRGVTPERPTTPPGDSEQLRFERFVASAPLAKRLTLDRLPGAKSSLGPIEVEVVYDEATRRAAARIVKGGPPRGEVLELWTLREGKPFSEGLISSGGFAFVENTGARDRLSGFAVSVEPPTGAKDRESPSNVSLHKAL